MRKRNDFLYHVEDENKKGKEKISNPPRRSFFF